MNHYIVDFQVTIDGKKIESGTIGTTDYKPHMVKKIVEDQFRRNIPHANSIAVVLINKKIVSTEDYIKASKNFLQIS